MSHHRTQTSRRADAGRVGLPDAFAEFYRRPFGFSEPHLYANFAASLDGVVAIPTENAALGELWIELS